MPLWLWPVQGGEPRRMGEAIGHEPAWSPDGTQIIYVRGRSLYTIHPDGTQLRELAHGPGLPHFPAWSSDGETIRFSMDKREDGTPSRLGNGRRWFPFASDSRQREAAGLSVRRAVDRGRQVFSFLRLRKLRLQPLGNPRSLELAPPIAS